MALLAAHAQSSYTIGIITALPIERAAMTAMLDERHGTPTGFVQTRDPNAYTWGCIGGHNIVITSLPAGVYGTTTATTTALPMLSSVPSIKFGLMVGIGAGVPSKSRDIRLGDVVVSQPSGTSGGVFQYDLGKAKKDSWERKDYLARPPEVLLKALANLQAEHELETACALVFLKDAATRNKKWGMAFAYPEHCSDRLFDSSYEHSGEDCTSCDPTQQIERKSRPSRDFEIHYGTIASGNSLIKSAKERDRIAKLEDQCLCIEMEATGLMNNFPCLVIRGICDYGDSHKNDAWQRYASSTAAALAKELLGYVPRSDLQTASKATDPIDALGVDSGHQLNHVNRLDNYGEITKALDKLLKGSYVEQKNRNSERIEGTCDWFISHARFRQWLDSKTFSLLWISADPGCGKSVLARYLIDKILPAPDRTICYFFFKDDQLDQNTSTNALCAFLHQIIAQGHQNLDLSELANLTSPDFQVTGSFDRLWKIFLSSAFAVETEEIVCVFDALDECEEDTRKQLFHAFGTLDVKRSTKLKLLVTGRPYDDLKHEFRTLHRSLPTIHLAGEDEVEVAKISREIDIVTDYKVKELGVGKSLEPAEIAFLQNQLRSVSNRTYLWVTLVIDVIKKTPGFTKGNVHAAIKTVPPTIDDAYEKILSRSTDEGKARKLLSLILIATRPLLVEEVAIASVITETHTSLDDLQEHLEPVSRAEATIRHICGLFVTIVNSRLYLLHQTARDFLIHSSETSDEATIPKAKKHKRRRAAKWKATIFLPEAHKVLAQSCICYLNLLTEPFRRTNFYEYAAIHWMIHVREAQGICSDSTVKSAADFCRSTSAAPKVWSFVYCEIDPFFDTRLHETTNRCSNLMVAAYFGLVQVAKYILSTGSSINAVDLDRITALSWAVRERHASVVRLLLDSGANYDLKDIQRQKALDWAVSMEDISIARLCLERYIQDRMQHHRDRLPLTTHGKGTAYSMIAKDPLNFERLLTQQPDFRALSERLQIAWHYDSAYSTALLRAVRNGHLMSIQTLLDQGRDIDELNEGTTPLICATIDNRLEVVQFLLRQGADINLKDMMGDTALTTAANHGYLDVVRLLLRQGADVSLANKDHWIALTRAASRGHLDLVQLLLERCANVDLAGPHGDTALFHSASEGHLQVVQLLLDRGANINLFEEKGMTALMKAALQGHLEVMQLLLDRGASIDLANKWGQTALLEAAWQGHLRVVQLLLERGASIDLADKFGQTALMEAAWQDHRQVLQLLLEVGAKVDLTSKESRTPLMMAAWRGHLRIVQLLLEKDASIDLADHKGQTALVKAASRGHLDIVQLLLNSGSEIDLDDDDGLTALVWATREGHLSTVEFLLEEGADSSIPNVKGKTVLGWAFAFDRHDIVKML